MRVMCVVCLFLLTVQAYPEGRGKSTNYINISRHGAVKKLSMGGAFNVASIVKNIIGIVMGGKKFNEDWLGKDLFSEDWFGDTETAPENKAVKKLSLMSALFDLAGMTANILGIVMDGKKMSEQGLG